MTDGANAASPADGENFGFCSVSRGGSFLLDGWAHERGEPPEARSGWGIEMLVASDFSRLVKARPRERLQSESAGQDLRTATHWRLMRLLVEARQSMLSMHVKGGFSRIAQIEPLLADLPPKVAKKMEAAVSLLRAIGFALQDEIPTALSFAQSTIKRMSEFPDNRLAITICRLAFWKLGELDSFFALPRGRPKSTTGGRGAICDIFDLAIDATVELDQLRLSSARRLAQDALELATKSFARYPALAALPASLIAQLLYQQGNIDEAEEMIQRHMPAIESGGCIESALRAYPILARIASHRGRHEHATVILKQAESLAEQRGWYRLTAASISERVNLLLEEDRLADAQACADSLARLAASFDMGPSRVWVDIHRTWTLIRARIALAQSSSQIAIAMLRRLQQDAVYKRDLHEALQLGILLVDALDRSGEETEALAVLVRALTLGSAVGIYQAFLDGGPSVEGYLVNIFECARTADSPLRELLPFVGSLLTRWKVNAAITPSPTSKSMLSGGLSERERITLVWMSHGLSNKGIAKKLGITPETVKSHAKSIYLKLTVKTRAEAVSRAGSLGIISTRSPNQGI